MEALEQELKAVREWDGGGRFTGSPACTRLVG